MSDVRKAIRDAAILIDSLAPRAADALLDQMPAEQAARIRLAVMEIGDINADERDRVVEQFMQGGGALDESADGGIELGESLAAKLTNEEAEETYLESTATINEEVAPFQFLRAATSDSLATFLRHEHPQTIAVVLANLPSERAAEVLSHLPNNIHTDVLRRVAELDDTDPEIIRDVEYGLKCLLSNEIRTTERRSAGLATAKAIVSAANQDEREQILANVCNSDRQLAEQLFDLTDIAREVSHPTDQVLAEGDSRNVSYDVGGESPCAIPLQFNDLASLDDHSLALVLKAAAPSVTLLALTGARRKFVDRILRQLSAREAKQFCMKMEQSGPLRLDDIDQAQKHLAQVASQLAAEGKLTVPKARRFTVAA